MPELIPRTSFFKNVRALVSSSEWDDIRFGCYGRAGNKCEICGLETRRLDCHEKWEYVKKEGVQRLVGLVALCPACHQVKHIGLAQIRGKEDVAQLHMMKVNEISRLECIALIKQAFNVWAERSKMKWKLDVSLLDKFKGKRSEV